jgi:hypothetical protein
LLITMSSRPNASAAVSTAANTAARVADIQRESDQPALGPGLQIYQLSGLPDGSHNHIAAGQRDLGK